MVKNMQFREIFERCYAKTHMGSESDENIDSIASLRNGETYDDEHLAGSWDLVKSMRSRMAFRPRMEFDDWVEGVDW